VVDRRGGHNRTFTLDQESLLVEQLHAAPCAVTGSEVRRAALQLKQDIAVAEQHGVARPDRRARPFKASPRWLSRLKLTHRLSSHRAAVSFRSSAAVDPVEKEHQILEFVREVREAVETYGARHVLNMDETPVGKCEHPVTGIVRTGSGLAARCTSTAGNRLNVTHFPTISAAGDHLQLCAIIQGKTPRTLKKVQENASAAVRKVRLYYSQSGWTNAAIIERWLEDVVAPFLGGHAGALVLDDYAAHWTDSVQAAAAALHMQLIRVPPGLTSEYQPLDVSFNGPMVKARQKLWLRNRVARPDCLDSHQAAVERCQIAYEGISRASTVDAWRKAYLVD
jgi:hypothetical protein